MVWLKLRQCFSTAELKRYIQVQVGTENVVVNNREDPFYHCAGYCNDVQSFPTPPTSVPLKEQTDHDKYWDTNDMLVSQRIIPSGPTPSCIGYRYQSFELNYLKQSAEDTVFHQEYINYPTRCACV